MQSSSAIHLNTPVPPFDRIPAPRTISGIGYYWWLPQKALLITQTSTPQVTIVASNALHDLIDDLLAREKALVEAAGGMTFVHDWRTVRSSEEGVREAFIQRMRQRQRGYQRLAILIINADNTVMHMAVMAGNAVAALATGRRVQITSDPVAALAEVGIR